MNNRIIKLIAQKLVSGVSEQEQMEITEWIQSSEKNQALFIRLTDKGYLAKHLFRIYSVNKAAGWFHYKNQYLTRRHTHIRVFLAKRFHWFRDRFY